MADENAIRRAGMLEAVDICEDYARAQFELPYPCAEACGLAAQVLASKIRTVADTIGLSRPRPMETRMAEDKIIAKLTKAQRQIMRSFTPETYAINFPRDRVQALVKLGLLEWLPPVWGNAHNWGATPRGLEVAQYLNAQGGPASQEQAREKD